MSEEVEKKDPSPMVEPQAVRSAPAVDLAQVFSEHHDRVFRAAFRITGSLTDAEDVVQTVFLRLAGRSGAAWSIDNPASYFYRAAINVSLDLLRARGEGRLLPLAAVEHSAAAEQASPETSDATAALRACLRRVLSRLRPRWAEMFVLKHIEGMDNAEIAHAIGTSKAVVAVTLHRARARLRRDLRALRGA